MKRTTTFIALLAIAGMIGAAVAGAQRSDDDERRIPQIDTLQNEYLQTLREREMLVRAAFQSGNTGLQDVIEASNDLIEAKLEFARTAEQRMALLRQRVENLRKLEETIHQYVELGQTGREDLLLARAQRMKAEIELLRAQSGNR